MQQYVPQLSTSFNKWFKHKAYCCLNYKFYEPQTTTMKTEILNMAKLGIQKA